MALTEELTFRLGDDGVILNTDSVSIPFVDITDVVGLDNAPYRETERDHEGADGGFMDAEFERGRPIVLTGTIYADTSSMETYLDLLKEDFAPSTSLVPFYYKAPGVDERVLFVKPQGCKYDWNQIRRTGQASVQFKVFAEDSRIYTAALSSQVIPFGGTAATGFGFNLGFNFGFGAPAGTDGAFVTNLGNRPTPPTFIFTGPADTPIIIDETYGHTLRFNTILGASDTLTVNTQYRTVKLNGTVNRRSVLTDPDWFFLQKGLTFLRYTALSGASSFVTVEFRSAFR